MAEFGSVIEAVLREKRVVVGVVEDEGGEESCWKFESGRDKIIYDWCGEDSLELVSQPAFCPIQ